MILFRIVCFLQMLITVFLTFTSVISLFSTGRLYFVIESLAFMLMAALAILGLTLMSTHYPDKPVTGKQKSVFNWLFLLNFLLLAFVFALFFSSLKQLKLASLVLSKPVLSLPLEFLVSFGITIVLLIFHFMILYGLYNLRRKLYINFYANKQFEFEKREEVNI